jgi:hypothetical protein
MQWQTLVPVVVVAVGMNVRLPTNRGWPVTVVRVLLLLPIQITFH